MSCLGAVSNLECKTRKKKPIKILVLFELFFEIVKSRTDELLLFKYEKDALSIGGAVMKGVKSTPIKTNKSSLHIEVPLSPTYSDFYNLVYNTQKKI